MTPSSALSSLLLLLPVCLLLLEDSSGWLHVSYRGGLSQGRRDSSVPNHHHHHGRTSRDQHRPSCRRSLGSDQFIRYVVGNSLDIGNISVAGEDPDRYKVNQDASFCCSRDDDVTILGVLDGHGTKGHVLTNYLKEHLPKRILQLLHKPETVTETDRELLAQLKQNLRKVGRAEDDIELLANMDDHSSSLCCKNNRYYASILTNSFYLAHLDAQLEPGIPSQRSGTTCIVALLLHDDEMTMDDDTTGRLHIAHVGDSQALWKYTGSDLINDSSSSHTVRSSQELHSTIPTTTRVASERQRIQHCIDRNSNGGARIDAQGNVFYGPQGIAMTRSLGNAVMLPAGVVPTPVIVAVQDLPEWLVLMTDGISDVLSRERIKAAMEDNATTSSVQQAVEDLAKQAREAWQGGLSMEVKIDDITCVAARRKDLYHYLHCSHTTSNRYQVLKQA